MANDKDFVVKNAVEVGGSTKTTLGTVTENVQQTSYDIANASYDSKSFSVASQETNFLAFFIDNSGTRLFAVGYANDTVYQYTMSTAWDVSSASYDSKSFSVASQMTIPRALSFSSDGTKMYVGEYTTIYEYDLSTAWDVSTASYNSVSFSPSSQTSALHEIVLSPDGTKMYIVALNESSLFQYSLSTAYDLSTASYASKSLSVSSQDSTPYGLAFNSDGTKAYVSGGNTYTVYQYNLTTAYDLSTGSYASISFDASAQGANNQICLVFKTDGTKMYLAGLGDTIYQYSTASYADQINLDTGNYFAHSPSGTTTYTISNAGDVQSFQVEVTGGADEVAQSFSTTTYTGTGASQTITNNIDLSTDGGLVWLKQRSTAAHHRLFDTVRGVNKALSSSLTANEANLTSGLTDFNSNGFTIGTESTINTSAETYVSWTFKKESNFFDIVTYTGNGTAGRTVSHNLGSTPGMIIVKSTGTGNWWVYHRGAQGVGGFDAEQLFFQLEGTQAYNDNIGWWNNTAPTSSDFTLGSSATNTSATDYVAYLFAHDTASDGLIQCGSYTNNSSANVEINLGWTPQWILVKNVSDAADWIILDNQRGLIDNPTTASSPELQANTTSAESNTRALIPTSTGFYVQSGVDARYNSGATTGTKTYIYMAIRSAADLDLTWPTSIEWAGGVAPAAPATGETDLFSISTGDGGTTYQGFKTADNLS